MFPNTMEREVEFPSDLRYTDNDEWIRFLGDVCTVGISAFAQDALGDIIYVDLPDVGRRVTRGEAICDIESAKTVSEIFSPADGEIVEVNTELDGAEDLVNSDPYGQGWLFRVRMSSPPPAAFSLSSEAYRTKVGAT